MIAYMYTCTCIFLFVLVSQVMTQNEECTPYSAFNVSPKKLISDIPKTHKDMEEACQKIFPGYQIIQSIVQLNISELDNLCDGEELVPLKEGFSTKNMPSVQVLNLRTGFKQMIPSDDYLFKCAICITSRKLNLSSPDYPNPTLSENFSIYHGTVETSTPEQTSKTFSFNTTSLIKYLANTLTVPSNSIEILNSNISKLMGIETHFSVSVPFNHMLLTINEIQNGTHTISNSNYRLVDIKNIDYCPEEILIDWQGNRIVWPSTLRGSVALQSANNQSNTLLRRECKYDPSLPDGRRSSWTRPTLWTEEDCTKKKSIYLVLVFYTICFSLSFLGLLSIAITAIMFRKWRNELSNVILLNLSASLAIPYTLGLSQEYFFLSRTTCIVIGVTYHYFLLTTFFWTFVMSGLQLLRILTVLGAKGINNLLLKITLFAWGVPVIPICILVTWDVDRFYPLWESRGYCYPKGTESYITVRAPMIIILIANMVIFTLIVCRINYFCGWGRTNDLTRHGIDRRTAALRNLKQSILLFFLFGLPWVMFQDEVVLQGGPDVYLGLFLLSVTGVILFVYFVLLDPLAVRLWKDSFHKLKNNILSVINGQ